MYELHHFGFFVSEGDTDGVAPTVALLRSAAAEGLTHGPPWPQPSSTWWLTVGRAVRVGVTGDRVTDVVRVRV